MADDLENISEVKEEWIEETVTEVDIKEEPETDRYPNAGICNGGMENSAYYSMKVEETWVDDVNVLAKADVTTPYVLEDPLSSSHSAWKVAIKDEPADDGTLEVGECSSATEEFAGAELAGPSSVPPHAHKIKIEDVATNDEKIDVEYLYACDICGFKCSLAGGLKRHMRIHIREVKYACVICSYKTTFFNSLLRHMKNNHPAEDDEYACYVCGYKCNRASDLENHTKTHTGEMRYACNACGFKCSKAGRLKRHIEIHIGTGGKLYECDVCSYKFRTRSALWTHRKVFACEKPNVCEFCDHKSCSSFAMKIHKKVHNSEKSYACEYCNYKCIQHRNWKAHIMKWHDPEKPFACSLCSYRFSEAGDLERHTVNHTAEKPFACNVCGKSFRYNYKVTRHMKTHTRKKLA